ncbi:MAG: AtpZ/AtpI family protein [Chloroflexi bacterium]|nr:AtpZ/AtpI family protein [Chloroflexota bacterium]MCY3697011.1 AtpZ/AtpI family protein [Chloroflexota bacterium]MXX32852.1 hypothetical protein [Chloroflexota bacterium]MXX79536.1 hypothetical protein [Chloroflexota bacterium]MYB23152.1 hypothetical protein [Chloroflexota bacterium]
MRQWPAAMQLMGIGWYVATCIVLGVVGGVLLDDEFGTDFVLTLVGLGLGLAAAGWGGYRMLQDLFAAQAKQRDAERRPSDDAPADDEQEEEERA